MCGEQLRIAQTATNEQGSPPRVRGTEIHLPAFARMQGITPACAGNSKNIRRIIDIQGDHPRVCGEQWLDLTEGPGGLGSPPRVRGTGG